MNAEDLPHHVPIDELLAHYQVSAWEGLSDQKVQEAREKYGENELSKEKPVNLFYLFFKQFYSPIVLLLLLAATISFIFGDVADAIAILVVTLINSVVGFLMEWQAHRSVMSLRELDILKARVVRDNSVKEIPVKELVPGDIVLLEAGDVVSADGRLLEVARIEINESALTGESMPVEKNTDVISPEAGLADRVNMVYRGTNVMNGNGKFLVTATGQHTEIGKISEMLTDAKTSNSPLEKKLDSITKKLIFITLAISSVFLISGLVQGKEWHRLLETSIALAVAAIPEGLPIVATIALAYGMMRLAGQNAIVKKLVAVEALGSTTMIFTDKTGTLTENNISVEKEIPGSSLIPSLPKDREVDLLYQVAVLCNNAVHNDEKNTDIGDPLEIALLKYVYGKDQKYKELRERLQRADEIPFTSESKSMITLYQDGQEWRTLAKGAIESILTMCNVSGEDKKKIIQQSEELSAGGLRVLGFAYQLSGDRPPVMDMDKDLVFAGLIAFIDPPRKGVDEAIASCHRAGINVAMVTGDHHATALYIAKQVKLVPQEESNFITGQDLSEKGMDREELYSTKVFSRVSPAQKLELVKRYQGRKYIVAMTGDGVNDAPALKTADIGVAMGKNGTQVAREASDIILKDDAFQTIVYAIKQGRVIFRNIRKFMVFLISCNLSEILVIAVLGLLNTGAELLPLQILFMNIITDVFPALALGMSKGDETIMEKKPIDADAPLLNRHEWRLIWLFSVLLTLSCLGVYAYTALYLHLPSAEVNNVIFYSLAFAQLVHVFNMSSAKVSFWNNEITRNIYVWGALVICLAIIIFTHENELMRKVLKITIAGGDDLWIIALAGFVPFIISKVIRRFVTF